MFDYLAYCAETKQSLLRSSRRHRQRAIAEFPLRVAGMAKDLEHLCKVDESGMPMSTEAKAAMDYMEKQIQEVFVEMFGKTMVD